MINPEEILRAGAEILRPIMEPSGFAFVEGQSGGSSGGRFARGDFVRGDRRLELHLRHSLGLVTYHVGPYSATHDAYMREVLGGRGGNHYPGFPSDPLDGFRHLAHDLATFAGDFLTGDGGAVMRAAFKDAAAHDGRQEAETARAAGDTAKREEARRHFRGGDFKRVIELLGSLQYPELMTEAERKYLEISRRKCQ
jgi:hypothetical protein